MVFGGTVGGWRSNPKAHLLTLIIVIDDDQSVRTAVQVWLERRGMHVIVADCNAGDIGHFETFAIDLAIVEIFMPDVDGLVIIRRFSQWTPKVPVIALCGPLSHDRYETAPDFLSMAGRLGAAFCLRKPFPADRLMAPLEACLGAPNEKTGHKEAGHKEAGHKEARAAVMLTCSGARIGRQFHKWLPLSEGATGSRALEIL
jgi:DNA-binding NtrC family response regulator